MVSQPTSSPVTWCSVGCHASVTQPAHWKRGDCAFSALPPWGCAGVPVSPWALGSAEWLCASFEPGPPGCWESRFQCWWSWLGWGGLSVPGQHQRSSLTALCKLSWGRFLLRFLPPAVLPALAWGARLEAASFPLDAAQACRPRGRMRWLGQRPEGQVRGCGTARLPVAGAEAKQGRSGSAAGWDAWAFPEVRQEAER